MARTSFKLCSPHSSSMRRGVPQLLALLLLSGSGCASYSRITLPKAEFHAPRTADSPRFCVVDCILETDRTFAVVPGEKGGRSICSVPGIQPSLQAACPDWFSSDEDSIPIVLKLKTVVTSVYGEGCVLPWLLPNIVSFCSLATIPVVNSAPFFELSIALQLDSNGWSDSETFPSKQESIGANRLTLALFPSLHAPEKGWQAEVDDVTRDEDLEASQQLAMASPHGQFSLIPFLKYGDGPGGANPVFAIFLANEIVQVWEKLSPMEKHRVRSNPVAQKKYKELHPETDIQKKSSNIPVAIPGPISGVLRPEASPPAVKGYAYIVESRRGYVEFNRKDAEYLTALKWVRDEIIPKLTGKGAVIRICSEKTFDNGITRVDFEVLQ